MRKYTGRLALDEYNRPVKTVTESVQDKKSIQKYLKEYEEISVEDLPYVNPDTHMRYISWDKKNKCELFRFGGLLVKVNKEYVLLAGKGGKTFSAQRFTFDDNNKKIHTTRFFKKMKNEDILREELDDTLETSKEIIKQQKEIIEKQKKELEKLKKSKKK
tara:strand:- start:1056 stop:1535 length:480 start_codon:yes stop_codon:yes gene_type:complete